MMADIFLSLLNISLTASWMALAVILVRLVFKKAPKWLYCMLWGFVGLRLIFPFSVQSIFSLVPSRETFPDGITMSQSPQIDSGFDFVDNAINPIISDKLAPTVGASVNPIQIISEIAATVWLCGVIAMLVYAAVSYARIYMKVRPSVLYRDNIFFCDDIDTPFILGVIRPKIYVPSGIDTEYMDIIIAHENAHLERKDQLSKPIGFLLLAVYWFNPVLWIAYVLLCRDIESACDERVIKEMSDEARKGYSEALVACSVHRRAIMACPLAFGEVGVKDRIKSVLSYKRPAFWIIVAALVISLVVAVCFMTDPFEYGIGKRNCGIVGFDISQNADGGATLTFKYLDITGYSVRIVSEDEGMYIGDGMIPYDGSLGKYRVMISIYDASPNSEGFAKELKTLGAINSHLNVRTAYPDDSTIVIYICSDHPLIAEEKEGFKPNALGGSFKVKISIDEEVSSSATFVKLTGYGSNVEGLSIKPIEARLENGDIIFDVKWINATSKTQSIGPNFTVYRMQGGEWVALEHRSVWLYYLQIVNGNSESNASYNISEHFDVSEPGVYRMEIYDGWVEFEIYENELKANEITYAMIRAENAVITEVKDTEALEKLVNALSGLSGVSCGRTSENKSDIYRIYLYNSDGDEFSYTLREGSLYSVYSPLDYIYPVVGFEHDDYELWYDGKVDSVIELLREICS